jgi:hypothetical protein
MFNGRCQGMAERWRRGAALASAKAFEHLWVFRLSVGEFQVQRKKSLSGRWQ